MMENHVGTQGLVGAEDHQGSLHTLPVSASQVSLGTANKRAVNITKPVLSNNQQAVPS